MKYVLPQYVTPLVRCFEMRGQRRAGIAMLSGWRFDGTPVHIADLWAEVGEDLPSGTALDQGIPKSRGELIVVAEACSGVPVEGVHVRVQVGSIDKVLYVFGDREWRNGVPTAPVPFQRMRLGWERAYGGDGFAPNPMGRGATGSAEGGQLPNIERPGHLVVSAGDRPDPQGFGALDVTWPQRSQFVGTYDDRWQRTRYPGFADDTDWRLFQLASKDQWLEGMWRGDEAVAFENLHPTQLSMTGRLPGVRARAFLSRVDGEGLEEAPLRLSTVWALPHRELFVLVHHGSVDVGESDGSDIKLLLAGFEGLPEARPKAHYEGVLSQRLDPEWGALHSLRDGDLMPSHLALLPGPGGSEIELSLRDGRIEENLRRRSASAQDRLYESLREAGGTPPVIPLAPTPSPVPALHEVPDYLAEAKREAGAARDASAQRIARLFEGAGRSPEPLSGGPPLLAGALLRSQIVSLVEEGKRLGEPVERLEGQLADPVFQGQLTKQDEATKEIYRRTAHRRTAAEELAQEDALQKRALVVKAKEQCQSVAGLDLTGADLSHLDLRGALLEGAWLEGANLQCADLRGADLSKAVLTRADLSDAKLDGARMSGANLGHARLLWVSAPSGVDLSDAILHGADLRGAGLPNSNLSRADLTEVRFEETDLSKVDAQGMTLVNSSLAGVRLVGANLAGANLIEVDLSGVDFTGAKLEGAVLLSCNAEGAVFVVARLDNLRAVEGCVFDRANFEEASLLMANLRGSSLVEASFVRAELDAADLSECDATEAVFYRATAKGARFVKTNLTGGQLVSVNLMGALLTEAIVDGADFRASNLFAADLWDAKGVANLDGALTTRVRFRREATA